MMKKGLVVFSLIAALLIGGLGISDTALAYDPRDYVAAPAGTNLLLWYYKYGSGNNLYANGDKVSNDANLKQNIGIFRYVRFVEIFGITADPQFLIPFGNASAKFGAGGTETSTSGLGDALFACTFWLVNKPDSKTWLGFTQYITAPTGEYQNNKLLNLGANRWAFKEEFGFTKGFGTTGLFLDLGAGVEFYTDNTDFGVNSQKLSQDPLYNAEVHLSKDITKVSFISADYFFNYGAKQKLNDMDLPNTETRKHTAGLTVGYNFSPGYQLLLQYQSDLSTENGIKANTFGARFMYAF